MKRIKQSIDINAGKERIKQMDAGKKKIKQNSDVDAGNKKNKSELNWRDGTLTVEEARELLQLSKTKIYELVNRGEFPIMRIDNVIRIPRSGFDKWFRENCA